MPAGELSAHLQNKVAWITGGGSGIGLAAAVALAKAGAKVVISGRSEKTLKDALKQFKAEALACDVGMRKRKQGLIINVSSWFGRYANALGGPGYGATKRAVIALTEQLNIEECTNGIRATSVLPGEAATPILEKRPVPPSPEVRAKMLQPEDLGRTLAFIAGLPPRVCINEIIISPTWNRFLIGGLEAPKS